MRNSAIMTLTRLLLLLALYAAAVQGQGIPSSAECQNRANSIGQTGLLQQLSSCQSGATPQCCQAASSLLGFPGSGQLAGCLCNADVLEATLVGIDQNSLARAAGVGRDEVQQRFDACNIPNAARAGSCPAGGAAAQAEPAASPSGSPSAAPATTTSEAPQAETATSPKPSPKPTPAPPAGGKFGDWYPGKYLGMAAGKFSGRKLLQTSVDVSAPFTNVAVNTGAKSQASADASTSTASSPAASVATNSGGGQIGKGGLIAAVHQAAAAKAAQVADAVNKAYQAKVDAVNGAVKAATDAHSSAQTQATASTTTNDQASKHPLLAKLAMGHR